MIRFLIKGLLRDRSRSLFPVMVVAIGVALTVLLQSWINGVMSDMIRSNANYSTGHIKLTTRAYAANEEQNPNDLALLDAGPLTDRLQKKYPGLHFVSRIRFGGLLDIPDEQGETREQAPVAGLGIDLLSPGSTEADRLNIRKSIIRGRMPEKPGEVLVSEDLARKLAVGPGRAATVLGSTMYGSMAMHNFTIVGTVRFGIAAMDRGAMVADLDDVRRMLDMEDTAAELLGYFDDGQYRDTAAVRIVAEVNAAVDNPTDEFAPVMRALRDQNDLAEYLDLAKNMTRIISGVFVVAMSIVLWNLGLIAGLRRYGEIGVRLAIGEQKGHIYCSMLLESVAVGLLGTLAGIAVGLIPAWYLQEYGVDIGAMMDNSSMMISSVMRAQITVQTFLIGFVPGLLSTVLGTALAGTGIYRRQTSQLFKELEV
ncbi:MAG: FtsX-like permease family protein [Kiritimatiellae bacterium]|nr:FtsX-like permease family protein [Kiritimatiellia bacterium]